MLLTIDIGNTNTVLGVIGDQLLAAKNAQHRIRVADVDR